jgi:tRNA threonylcarbamoyl adenosine modification protein YeaZ
MTAPSEKTPSKETPENRRTPLSEIRKLKILSFDTSTSDLHLAVADGEEIVLSKKITSDLGNRQYAASELIPSIDAILTEAGWHKKDLDAIAVGAGPGSFTGVRAAVVTARTLAQALQIALCSVSIFDCFALEWASSQAQVGPGAFAIILDAGREHCYLAEYRLDDRQTESSKFPRLEPSTAPASLKMPDLINKLSTTKMTESTPLLADQTIVTRLESHGFQCFPAPVLANIAVLQSKIVFHRLSLKHNPSQDLREELLKSYPYSQVQPLYLREASVTLKGAAK